MMTFTYFEVLMIFFLAGVIFGVALMTVKFKFYPNPQGWRDLWSALTMKLSWKLDRV